jgi:hypothetical protein
MARRVIVTAFTAVALALGLAAGPVGATQYLHDRYSDDEQFTFDECGYLLDVTAHAEGVAHIRTGKGDQASAFFLHDNYEFHETWTRRDTGEWFTISGNGLFQETRAIHIGGTQFAFRSVDAGRPFVVTAQDGTVIVRDRGVIRQEIIFDTLGDATPGGEFVEFVSVSVAGPHPGLDFDICAVLG